MDCACALNNMGNLSGSYGSNAPNANGSAYGSAYGMTDAELDAWDPYKAGTGVAGTSGGGKGWQAIGQIAGGLFSAFSASQQAKAAQAQRDMQLAQAQAFAQAQAQAMMMGQQAAPRPAAAGMSGTTVALLIGGAVLTVAGIGGLAFVATRPKARAARRR
jgi:hypothetical protein